MTTSTDQKVNGEQPSALPSAGSQATPELKAAHSPLPWKLFEGLIFCTMRPKYRHMDEQPAVAACTKESAKDAAFVEERYEVDDPAAMCRANAELIVRAVNNHDSLLSAAKEALAWLAAFPHKGSASHFDITTAEEVYDKLRTAITEAEKQSG